MASVHPSSSSSLPTRTHLSSPSASTLSTHSISIKSILDPNPFSIQSWWNSFSVAISQNIESQSNPFSIQSNPDPFSIQSSANPSKPVSIKSTKTQFQFISFKLSTLIQFIIDANLNFKPLQIQVNLNISKPKSGVELYIHNSLVVLWSPTSSWSHSSCLESLYILSRYDELSSYKQEWGSTDNASLLLRICCSRRWIASLLSPALWLYAFLSPFKFGMKLNWLSHSFNDICILVDALNIQPIPFYGCAILGWLLSL